MTTSMKDSKRVSALSVVDLGKCPVWKFAQSDDDGEPLVLPVSKVPVSSLAGKLIGTKVRLGNGTEAWAVIGNVDGNNRRLNQHFVAISIEREGHWFHLARYHDREYGDYGPEQLSRFLNLSVDDVFPISYDLRAYAVGDPDALRGTIPREPLERLTRAQVIALAIPPRTR